MELTKNALIEYFNYDLESLLNEFNNYYVLKTAKIPLYIQSMYLYFSHLAENSLELLIQNSFNYKKALDIVNVPNIYIKPYSDTEINNFLKNYQSKPQIFYGLVGFPLYFFESFLNYIKYTQEQGIHSILKNIPIIEDNLTMIRKLL